MMTSVEWRFAPDAKWAAKTLFVAPVGRTDNGKKQAPYTFNTGETIYIDSIINGDQYLIRKADVSPYGTQSSYGVVFEPAWVSRDWIESHFHFQTNERYIAFQFYEGYEQPYSMLGVPRVLRDDEAAMEMLHAFYRGRTHLQCRIFYSGGTHRDVSLSGVFTMVRLLKEAGIIEGTAQDFYEGIYFANLLDPWAGLIVVNNGVDYARYEHRFFRRFGTRTNGQRTVFIVDDEEQYFQERLSHNGPVFLHRERSAAL